MLGQEHIMIDSSVTGVFESLIDVTAGEGGSNLYHVDNCDSFDVVNKTHKYALRFTLVFLTSDIVSM